MIYSYMYDVCLHIEYLCMPRDRNLHVDDKKYHMSVYYLMYIVYIYTAFQPTAQGYSIA